MSLDFDLGRKIDALRQLDFLTDLPFGMAVFDQQLSYVWINSMLAKINGLLVEEHLEKPVTFWSTYEVHLQ